MIGGAATKAAGFEMQRAAGSSITTAEAIRLVWTGNFIGVVCAWTLHCQFYS